MSGASDLAGPASVPTRSGAVYAQMRRDILRGALAPAAKLQIEEMCGKYGVTSTPIREALNQLSIEGFVRRVEQRGFFVAPASRQELVELTDTRCWVEEVALRQAIGHRTPAWEEALARTMQRLSRIDRSTGEATFASNPDWDAAHRDFHMALIAACPSGWLLRFCGLLFDHAARYRNLAMAVIYPARDVVAEHRALMQAALADTPDRAVALLAAHYRRTADIILGARPGLGDEARDPAGSAG